ncbi:MAG TPA: SMC-Scp complex subunit ScpB [Pyrinomonadaceae bacterium]|nr:SMC-Scp complex subunit ScpB [Pyrinomonadaceae bacterium]
MSKRIRKKKNSDETVDAVVRDILGPDVTAEAVGGVGVAAAANGAPPAGAEVETAADSVAELNDALEALDAGPEAAGEVEPPEAQTWADRVDPAGLASGDETEFAAEERDEAETADAERAGAEFADAGPEEAGSSAAGGHGESEVVDEEREVVIHDADAEDHAEQQARLRAESAGDGEGPAPDEDEVAPGGGPRELAELMAVCEALIFVSDEPLSAKALADVLKEEKGWVEVAVEELAKEFNERNGGLMLREVAGGWQLATRPEHHDSIRAFLKSKPSAKLSLAALETLAVIAYKQPITVPEILEIRGVQSSSAIKTLLDKRLIVAKGRKETVGRPMMYGTSKEFLMQFGLRDLGELPNVEDFDDLAAGGEA